MRMRLAGCFVLSTFLLVLGVGVAQERPNGTVVIPRTWDDAEIARHEVPLAVAAASPKHVSADYYYRIPVRPIYKSYPVYAHGREPAGYVDWLKTQEPVVLWDGTATAPRLETDADWIRAGELVFDAPLVMDVNFAVEDVRSAAWLAHTGAPVAAGGTLPWFQYVVRKKGVVELGQPLVRVLPHARHARREGAQGCAGQPADSARGRVPTGVPLPRPRPTRSNIAASPDVPQAAPRCAVSRPDPEDRIDTMSSTRSRRCSIRIRRVSRRAIAATRSRRFRFPT